MWIKIKQEQATFDEVGNPNPRQRRHNIDIFSTSWLILIILVVLAMLAGLLAVVTVDNNHSDNETTALIQITIDLVQPFVALVFYPSFALIRNRVEIKRHVIQMLS